MNSKGHAGGNGSGNSAAQAQAQAQGQGQPQGQTPAAAPGVYSFPLLKPSELVACIREMQIPVSEEELRGCEPQALRKVLEVFIESIMGVTREEMNQPQFAGLGALSYPELQEDAIPELAFFRQASRLLRACGIHDFGQRDLLTPTPKRVRRQLSALINFAKFRDERVAAFAELTRETDTLARRKMALQEENEALQRELQQLEIEQAADAPAIAQVTEENAALEEEINALNKQQAVMRHENSELKGRYQELKDEMASLQFNMLEAERMVQDLHGQIVTSPDRVKKEIAGIAFALEEAKEEMNAMDRRLRELQMYSDTFTRSEKDIVKVRELMEEIEGDQKKCKDAKEQVKAQRREIEENRSKALEIVSQRKRLEKMGDQKREQFDRFKEEAKLKEQAAVHALRAAQEELQQLESAHASARQRITAAKDTLRELEIKSREAELRFEKELAEVKQIFSRLQMSAQYYNTQLLDAIRNA